MFRGTMEDPELAELENLSTPSSLANKSFSN